MTIKRRIRKRDNRTQYIVVFQDLYNVNRFGGLIRALNYENAEFMAGCICGIVIGEIDKETGEEFYYEDKIQELNEHTLQDTWMY
tara:strand:- start:256 stop:510 length:255 start_codon:yes stop_codon:yes gene_type:complete